ncbi:MAG: hypothetical protein SPC24_01715 [Alphaproteobacteria bacterium]|nr:hypothetical protein [Alphaproteobacteria bacterium]
MTQYFAKIENRLAKYKSRYQQHPKKVALKLIWWNLCYLFSICKHKISFNDDKQHIAIVFAGGVGDYIYAAKYVEALTKYLSNDCVVDVLCPECDIPTIQAIFYDKKYINKVLSQEIKTEYDLHIRLVRFPVILSYVEKRLDAKTLEYVHKLENFHRENPLIIFNDYMGRCWSLLKGRVREDQADIDDILNMKQLKFEINIPANEKQILNKFGLEKQKFITLQTGSGVHFQDVTNEVRQWPVENYGKLAQSLKKSYPQYKIIQLGAVRQNKCQNLDIDLRGQTTIEELFVLLKYAKLHISQEGGMPIIRHFVQGGMSIVLFGPTDERFFGFEENVNLNARTCPVCCEWLTNDWMKKCLKSNGMSECMKNITVDSVMENIRKVLL